MSFVSRFLKFAFIPLVFAVSACQPADSFDSVDFASERPPQESMDAIVSVEEQTLYLYLDGVLRKTWKVSTARAGKSTPRGKYNAYWLSRHHRSSLYEDAPMPFAVFFNGDYAIHGTEWERYLGRPASAGCVRLSNENAEILFDWVEVIGMRNFTIEIVDEFENNTLGYTKGRGFQLSARRNSGNEDD